MGKNLVVWSSSKDRG